MRLVQLLVDDDHRDSVVSVLDEEGIDYLVDDGIDSDRGTVLVEFPLPDQAVEYVRNRLTEADVEAEYEITLAAESARTERIDDLEDRFITGTEEGDSIPADELRSTALDSHPDPLPYYTMTLVSALVAVAGLLLDSAALVVGAMVIAPQIGSALTASVGATIGDWPMITRGVRAQVLSLTLAILGAALFGISLQYLGFASPIIHLETIAQIGERVSPGLLALVVGIAAGIAGALGLATALPVSIVGVMIAAALIPAAAATGIGIAWNAPSVAVGALVLLVANLISINVAGALTLRWLGYRPSDVDRTRSPALWKPLFGVLLLGALVATGFAITGQATFENEVNGAVDDVLDEEEYEDLELTRIRTDFVLIPGSDSPTVQVVVYRPADRAYPQLPEELAEAITDATGRDVLLRVEFVDRLEHDTEQSHRDSAAVAADSR